MEKQGLNSIELSIIFIKEALKENKGIKSILLKNNKCENFVRDIFYRLNHKECFPSVSEKTKNEFIELYKEYLTKREERKREKVFIKEKPVKTETNENLSEEESKDLEYDAWIDPNYDERSSSEILRETDEEIEIYDGRKIKKITGYKYHILIRGEIGLDGFFTREEMDFVYRLYSNMGGAGLTLRSVSRYFQNLTYRDFKRILRAFNITKSSIPVAPHIIEESTEDEVRNIIFSNKEKNVLKKIEDERIEYLEKHLRETLQELCEVKIKVKDIKEYFKNINFDNIQPFIIEKKEVNNEKALIIYIADQHVGAKTLNDSLYPNEYNEKEFRNRMILTFKKIEELYNSFGRFDKLIICNLGDSLDGFNSQTTRGGHVLPQNMDNKEQFKIYVNIMIEFFESLHKINVTNQIEYQCVGNDNHSGDAGYIANKALELFFGQRYPEMRVNIFEKFIQSFDYGKHTFILSHGKDKSDMKNGFPLALDNRSESFFLAFIDNMRINNKNIHVVLADLHQSLTQFAKRFRWKRVSSMYGSSSWIHTNFGNTRAGVDFEIVNKNSDDIFESRIWF